jgi:hypothetical protein
LFAMKFSPVISRINVELASSASESASVSIIRVDPAGWSGDNAPDSYSEGIQFESRPSHWIS